MVAGLEPGRSIDNLLQSCLDHCASTDRSSRISAEFQLESASEKIPQFPLQLLHISLHRIAPFAQRLLAAVTLKSFIDSHWAKTLPEIKVQVKATLLSNALSEPIGKVRVALAYAITKIAHIDWPESWPELLPALLSNLQLGSQDQVHGAMRVLFELVSTDLSESQLPAVAPVLVPEMFKIFSGHDKKYLASIRSKAISIITEFIKIIFNLKESHPEECNSYISNILDQWIPSLARSLSMVDESMVVQVAICTALTTIHHCFRKLIPPDSILILFDVCTNLIKAHSESFTSVVVNSSVIDESTDSDGRVTSTETLISSLLDFLVLVVNEKSVKEARPLDALFDCVMGYAMVCERQRCSWEESVEEFVCEENETSFAFFVRKRVLEFFLNMVDMNGKDTVKAIIACVVRGIGSTNGGAVKNWWKVHEACLYILGNVCEDVGQALLEESTLIEDQFSQIAMLALQHAQRPDTPHFLRGRAVWFGGKYASQLPANIAGQFAQVATGLLGAAGGATIDKMFCTMAMGKFCESRSAEEMSQVCAAGIEGILATIGGCGDDLNQDVAGELLHSLIDLLKVNQGITASYEHALSPLLLRIWASFVFASDVFITGFMIDFFEVLSSNKLCFGAFESKMLPNLCALVAASRETLAAEEADRPLSRLLSPIVFGDVVVPVENINMMTPTALDFLALLVKGSDSQTLPSCYTQTLFPHLFPILLSTNSTPILQNGQEFLDALLSKYISSLLAWSDPSNASSLSGLDYTIQFIAKILSPQAPESSGLFIGRVVSKLIQKSGSLLEPMLPNLLGAVALRMSTAKMPSFVQTLVLVFCKLIVRGEQFDPRIIVTFLAGIQIKGWGSGLEMFLNIWCDNHPSFFGDYECKVSSVALAILCSLGDERLNAVRVKGDIIVTQRIVTRSRSKKEPDQYTSVQFPTKVLKLLAADYSGYEHHARFEDARERISGSCFGEDDESHTAEDGGDSDLEDEWADIRPFDFCTASHAARMVSSAGDLDDNANISELMGLRGRGALGGDLDKDPDVVADPVYGYDMKGYLGSFFRGCIAHGIVGVEFLNQAEQETLIKFR